MSLKMLLALVLSAACLISCQSLFQRESEWTYVGDGNKSTLETIEDCQERANDESNNYEFIDSYDPSSPYSGALGVFSAVTQHVGWQKSFDGCMNGRNFARDGDVDRLKKENQEFKEVREKRIRDDALKDAKRKTQEIEIGDFVTPKYESILIYKDKSTSSGRVAVGSASTKPKVLQIDGEWTRVELDSKVGWARSQAMKKVAPLIH